MSSGPTGEAARRCQAIVAEMSAALAAGTRLAKPGQDHAAAACWIRAQPWASRLWPDVTHNPYQDLSTAAWLRSRALGLEQPRPARVQAFQGGHLWPKDEPEIRFAIRALEFLSRLHSVSGNADRVLDRFEEARSAAQWRFDIEYPLRLGSCPRLDLEDFAAVRAEALCRAGCQLHQELGRLAWAKEDPAAALPGEDGSGIDPAALDELVEAAARLPRILAQLAPIWPALLSAFRRGQQSRLLTELPGWLLDLLREVPEPRLAGLAWDGVAAVPAGRLEQLSAGHVASFGAAGTPWWLGGWQMAAAHLDAASVRRGWPAG
ncbi:hypothetical protein [Geminicoccus harenae]|uniref:hypothetical protein n=1 Tax=Geminicoccus harenae TaxID=2498453 RepID=UPI001C9619A3|nr:hypothetical protein [Geminicoccus harenae]